MLLLSGVFMGSDVRHVFVKNVNDSRHLSKNVEKPQNYLDICIFVSVPASALFFILLTITLAVFIQLSFFAIDDYQAHIVAVIFTLNLVASIALFVVFLLKVNATANQPPTRNIVWFEARMCVQIRKIYDRLQLAQTDNWSSASMTTQEKQLSYYAHRDQSSKSYSLSSPESCPPENRQSSLYNRLVMLSR